MCDQFEARFAKPGDGLLDLGKVGFERAFGVDAETVRVRGFKVAGDTEAGLRGAGVGHTVEAAEPHDENQAVAEGGGEGHRT